MHQIRFFFFQIALLGLTACSQSNLPKTGVFETQCILDSDCTTLNPSYICANHICGLHNQSFWGPCSSNTDCSNGFVCDTADNFGTTTPHRCTSGNGTFDLPKGKLKTTGKQPSSIVAGDFNNDGIQDMAVANAGEFTISVFFGSGNGGFGTPTVIVSDPLALTNPEFLATGDFDKNGYLDLVAANSANSEINVFLNSDSGFSTPISHYSKAYDYPFSVAVGDVNQDGKLDFVTANGNHNTVTVFLGNGDGTFMPPSTAASGKEPLFIVMKDFNNDGKLDLATANNLDSTVSVLFGNGDGTFQTQVSYPVGSNPVSLCAGDFNADGLIDIATANQTAGTVSVLINTKSHKGVFATQVSYPAGSSPGSITTGRLKFNTLSLVVTNSDSSNVSILSGNGDGTFQAQTLYSIGNTSYPISSAIADFDNNGALDIAVTNPEDDSIEFLFSSQRIECLVDSDCTRVTWGNSCVNNMCVCSTATPQAVACSGNQPYCGATGCTCGTQQCLSGSLCVGEELSDGGYLRCAKEANCLPDGRGFFDSSGYACTCTANGLQGGAPENILCNPTYSTCTSAALLSHHASFSLCEPSFQYCVSAPLNTYLTTDPCCGSVAYVQNDQLPYGCSCSQSYKCLGGNCAIGGVCAPTSPCVTFKNQSGCITNGDFCYWETSNETCNACLLAPNCSYTTQSGCQGCTGCRWDSSSNTCALCPTDCTTINSQTNCTDCGCDWNLNLGSCL